MSEKTKSKRNNRPKKQNQEKNDNAEYKSTGIAVKSGQTDLMAYCDLQTHLAKLLKNTIIYRCRQLFFAKQKKFENLSDQELEVIKEFQTIDVDFSTGKIGWLPTYSQFEAMFRKTKNPDFLNDKISMQIKQHIIMQVLEDFTSFNSGFFEYLKNPSKFTGKPKLPGYAKSDHVTFEITNQDAKIKKITNKNNEIENFLKLPKTKILVRLGELEIKNLKTVQIMPYYDTYKIILTEEIEKSIESSTNTNRILGLDLGVDNFVAASNNCGLTPFVINGKELKSYNQWYNKTIAKERSLLPDGVYTSNNIQVLNKNRANKIADFYNKTASYIVKYCVDNKIDTIVVGKNIRWKENSNLGKNTNQSFCFIAHAAFIKTLKEVAKHFGIVVMTIEESYTSRASFLDDDYIPTYKKGSKLKHYFSGKRVHRGLYRSENGILINADINGASNIIKKVFPNAFDHLKDFGYLYTTVLKVHISKINTFDDGKNHQNLPKYKMENYKPKKNVNP